jgi:hypothetical protein
VCRKEDTLRPRDLEGLVERVANVPAFARSGAHLSGLCSRAVRLAANRFGTRFDPRSDRFSAFGAAWRLGAVFLSLPWPVEARPWQFLSGELLCVEWIGKQTAIVAKRERDRSGARIGWGRRLLRPFEEVGGVVQEYPMLATARPLGMIRAFLRTVGSYERS